MKSEFRMAIRRILRPVLKLMLRNGVDLADFMAEIRSICVDVAQDEDFALRDRKGNPKKITVSRIAMLTGMNRKEAKRIMDLADGEVELDEAYSNRAVRVISGWTRDRKYCDEEGQPYALSMGSNTADRRFEDLVKDYSGDMTPRVILDELLRVGSVTKDESGQINLVSKGYVPVLSNYELLAIGSEAIKDLTSTVVHNLNRMDNGDEFFQKSVHYDDVPLEAVKFYRAMVKEDANAFIDDQNRKLAGYDRSNTPKIPGTGRYRVGLGLYYFEEEYDG